MVGTAMLPSSFRHCAPLAHASTHPPPLGDSVNSTTAGEEGRVGLQHQHAVEAREARLQQQGVNVTKS